MSVKGTEVKINIHVEPISGIHLSECDFKVRFFVYTNRCVELLKDELIRVDDDNYIAVVDTAQTGAGTIRMTIEVDVPDSDCADGLRKEVETVCTGVTIRP